MAIATHFFYLTAFILGIFYSISAKSNEAEFATKHIASNEMLITYQDAKNDTPYQAKDESSSIHYFHSASAPPPPPKEDFIPSKEKDRCEKMILWYYHAADQGNVRAQVMLGVFHKVTRLQKRGLKRPVNRVIKNHVIFISMLLMGYGKNIHEYY